MLSFNNRKKLNKVLTNNLNGTFNNNEEKNLTFKGNNIEELFSIKSNENNDIHYNCSDCSLYNVE